MSDEDSKCKHCGIKGSKEEVSSTGPQHHSKCPRHFPWTGRRFPLRTRDELDEEARGWHGTQPRSLGGDVPD